MNNIFGGSISNQLYLVYGLIGVVVILIIIIIIMDSKAKKKLHKNLFDNKTLKRNLKHLEETGELPIVEAKPKKDYKFVKPAKKVKEMDAIEDMNENNITIVHETDEEVGLIPDNDSVPQVEKEEEVTSINITPVVIPEVESLPKKEEVKVVPKKEPVKEEVKVAPKEETKVVSVKMTPVKEDVKEIKEAKEEVKVRVDPVVEVPKEAIKEEPLPVPEVRRINRVYNIEPKDETPKIVNVPKEEHVQPFTKTTKDVEKNKEDLLDRVLDAGMGKFNSKEDKINQKKIEKKEELKELAEISGIDYVEEEEDPLEKTSAQIEVEKITEDLENGDSKLIESTQFEKEQERTAILSMDELMKKKDALMEENEAKQYLDDADSPISIKEFKEKVNSEKYKATPNEEIELLF